MMKIIAKKKGNAKTLNRQYLHNGAGGNVTLFLDETNSIIQKLLHLDYFEYERIKQQNPEKLQTIYTAEEIEMFDKIIEPFSTNGRNFHVENLLPRCDWHAIPGGIPSTLVNGICIRTNSLTKLSDIKNIDIDEIVKMFPKATIFDGKLNVIYTPLKDNTMQKQNQLEEVKQDAGQKEGTVQEPLGKNIKEPLESNLLNQNSLSQKLGQETISTSTQFIDETAQAMETQQRTQQEQKTSGVQET